MFCLDERLQADTVYLGRLPLSKVLLMKDSRYPWVILVPARTNVFEYYHLKKEDRLQLMEESTFVAEKMADHFAPDSVNVAELGNVVAQLHVHHIARFKTDPAWPGPVWGHSPAEPYSEQALAERIEEVTNLLSSHFIEESEADDDVQDTVYW
ncbi:MAG: HIT family protein [Thalassolituus sp.]|jgi:diadenosine tetraphosphate (Ap4A) HIT family hydrolase|uniref:HIT domain-containing protein n=1 Tax=Thalassolituus sp. TaxID=2030822 RepID=UPI0024395826|nr:HIT family protein [Pseudomonadota bacterium]TNC85218.1 MAG: HIT family protein [Thalassolituus sp.]